MQLKLIRVNFCGSYFYNLLNQSCPAFWVTTFDVDDVKNIRHKRDIFVRQKNSKESFMRFGNLNMKYFLFLLLLEILHYPFYPRSRRVKSVVFKHISMEYLPGFPCRNRG